MDEVYASAATFVRPFVCSVLSAQCCSFPLLLLAVRPQHANSELPDPDQKEIGCTDLLGPALVVGLELVRIGHLGLAYTVRLEIAHIDRLEIVHTDHFAAKHRFRTDRLLASQHTDLQKHHIHQIS